MDFKVKCLFCGEEMDGWYGDKLTSGLYRVDFVSCNCPNDKSRYSYTPVYDSIFYHYSFIVIEDLKKMNHVFFLRDDKNDNCRDSFKDYYLKGTDLYPLNQILLISRLLGGKWRSKLAFPTDRYLGGKLSNVLPDNPRSRELPKNIRMTVSGKNHLKKLEDCKLTPPEVGI